MRRLQALCLTCLFVTTSGLGMAQIVPRAPVVKIAAGTTPNILPDPTGVYAGAAIVMLQGQSGTFNQQWRIQIKAQSCAECAPGEYFIYGTNYDGCLYSSGVEERGGVYGFVSPTGNTVGLELFAINCPFVNPTNFRANVSGSNSFAGDEFGGSFGQVPGTAVTIKNGVLAGRFSGRDCFGQQITADVNLQRQSGAVATGCTSLAGTYNGTFANSCGGNGSGTITISQSGCDFSAYLTLLNGGLEGTMTSSTTAMVSLNDPCSVGIPTGSLNVAPNGTITGTYSATSRGGSGCCPAGPISGSFAATRQ